MRASARPARVPHMLSTGCHTGPMPAAGSPQDSCSRLLLGRPGRLISSAGLVQSAGSVVLFAAAALGLLLSGVALAAVAGPQGPAMLTLIVAGALVAAATTGAIGAPGVVSSLAAVFAFAGIPALIQLSLAWPHARPTRSAEHKLVAGTWVLVAGAGIAWVLVWTRTPTSGVCWAARPPAGHSPHARAARPVGLATSRSWSRSPHHGQHWRCMVRGSRPGSTVLVLAVEAAVAFPARDWSRRRWRSRSTRPAAHPWRWWGWRWWLHRDHRSPHRLVQLTPTCRWNDYRRTRHLRGLARGGPGRPPGHRLPPPLQPLRARQRTTSPRPRPPSPPARRQPDPVAIVVHPGPARRGHRHRAGASGAS